MSILFKDGWIFIVIPVILGIALMCFSKNALLSALGVILVVFGIFCLFFFRDPQRTVKTDESVILSPGDGKILEIEEDENRKTVRIFLSVFDVHLQRSPVSGVIEKIEYKPGRCLPAMNENAHVVNEQNIFTISSKLGTIEVIQIAGILARRVVSWVKEGQTVEQGERIGIIKFSSQVDISFNKSLNIKVQKGQRVVAGETVIAQKG